jgi:hypothetical protein
MKLDEVLLHGDGMALHLIVETLLGVEERLSWVIPALETGSDVLVILSHTSEPFSRLKLLLHDVRALSQYERV